MHLCKMFLHAEFSKFEEDFYIVSPTCYLFLFSRFCDVFLLCCAIKQSTRTAAKDGEKEKRRKVQRGRRRRRGRGEAKWTFELPKNRFLGQQENVTKLSERKRTRILLSGTPGSQHPDILRSLPLGPGGSRHVTKDTN